MSNARSNWVDKTVAFFSPQAGLERKMARLALVKMETYSQKRGYEGASKGRRTANWNAKNNSPNTENAPALDRLRARSRDLSRNNPWAKGAIDALETDIIGTGIIPSIKSGSKRRESEIGTLWEKWGDTIECDADGLHDFYGLEALVARTAHEAGEVLIRRRLRYSKDGLAIPMQLQVLEPDHLDTTKDGKLSNGGRIIQGVEFGPTGRRVAYWLYPEHPGDGFLFQSRESKRVPAEDICHLFEVLRPGQVRGIPTGTPAFIRIKDFDEYEDAQLVRQKIAACFTVFKKNVDAINDEAEEDDDSETQVEPGLITNLGPGFDVEFANPPGVDGYGDYTKTVLRAISRAYGVPYEVLTGDYSNVNFSSGRMGWLQYQRNIKKWQQRIMIPRFCQVVFGWFLEAAMIQGFRIDGVSVRWTPPKREMIDPTKEVPALRDSVRSGFISHQEAIRQGGEDPEVVYDEIEKTQQILDAKGIVLDSDPRKVARGGTFQPNYDGGSQE